MPWQLDTDHPALRRPGLLRLGRTTGGILLALVLALTVLAPAASAAVPVVVVSGKGFGHGVGMAQDGAYWMGVDGASHREILGQFYPGTTVGDGSGLIRVPVLSAGAEATVALPGGGEVRSSLDGPQSAGFPMAIPPGGEVTLRRAGDGVVAESSATPNGEATFETASVQLSGAAEPVEPPVTTEATVASLSPTPAQPPPTLAPMTPSPAQAPPSTLAPLAPAPARPPTSVGTAPAADPGPPPTPGGPAPTSPSAESQPPSTEPPADSAVAPAGSTLWVVPTPESAVALPGKGNRYRGAVEAVAAGGGIRLVNQIDVEDYLRGMGEVRDSRWPAASLQAQAVAARTYALRAMAAGGEICASQRCQVYLGQQAEYPAMDAAVAATKGQVLFHGGALASAVYSANGGGITATGKEGFGDAAGGAPYLQAQAYPTRDPDPWEVRIGLAELGSRLGYPAGLQSVAVSATGPSGRATEVELHGASGTRQVPARTFARALGLRSTLWSIDTGSAAEAPPSPPAGDLFQASPEDLSDDETLTYFPPPTTAQEGPLDGSTAIAATPVSPDTPVPWGLYLGVFLVGAALRRLAYLRNLTW